MPSRKNMNLALAVGGVGLACHDLPLVRGAKWTRGRPPSPVSRNGNDSGRPFGPADAPETPDRDRPSGGRGSPWNADVVLEPKVVRGAICDDGSDGVDSRKGKGVEGCVILDNIILNPGGSAHPAVDREVRIAGGRAGRQGREYALICNGT